MGKKQDRSIQLTRIAIRDPGGKQRKPHPLVSRFLRLLFFLTGCFSIHLWFATLFQLPVSLEFLGISTLILGIWYFIAFFSKITRLICIPLSMGIMIFVLVRMWDELYRGIGQMVNTASQYIMDYYFVNPGFLPAEADQGAVMATMVLLEAVMMLWLANSVLARKKSGGLDSQYSKRRPWCGPGCAKPKAPFRLDEFLPRLKADGPLSSAFVKTNGQTKRGFFRCPKNSLRPPCE